VKLLARLPHRKLATKLEEGEPDLLQTTMLRVAMPLRLANTRALLSLENMVIEIQDLGESLEEVSISAI